MDEPPPPYNTGGEDGKSSGAPSGDTEGRGIRFSLGFVRTPPGICLVVNIVCVNYW